MRQEPYLACQAARAPQGMPRDEATGGLLRRHGDEVERLPGGYYRALGRCDDTMNLGGIKARLLAHLASTPVDCA